MITENQLEQLTNSPSRVVHALVPYAIDYPMLNAFAVLDQQKTKNPDFRRGSSFSRARNYRSIINRCVRRSEPAITCTT